MVLEQHDYMRTYNILRKALAQRDTPQTLVHLITIPGGQTWALQQHQEPEALELALKLLLHPKIDIGVTPLDFMGGISNEDFPYFSQVHEPLVAIAIALKEKYIKYSRVANRYFANLDNPMVKEYIEDMQNRAVNPDNDIH